MGLMNDLLGPKWKHSHYYIRYEAVDKLDPYKDKAAIEFIVINEKESSVRSNAVAKLTNQAMLMEILINEKATLEDRLCAIKNLRKHDLNVIDQIAGNPQAPIGLRIEAAKILNNSVLLSELITIETFFQFIPLCVIPLFGKKNLDSTGLDSLHSTGNLDRDVILTKIVHLTVEVTRNKDINANSVFNFYSEILNTIVDNYSGRRDTSDSHGFIENITLKVIDNFEKINDKKMLAPVIKVIDKGFFSHTKIITKSLALLDNVQDKKYINSIIKYLGDENKEIREAAGKALLQLDEKELPKLIGENLNMLFSYNDSRIITAIYWAVKTFKSKGIYNQASYKSEASYIIRKAIDAFYKFDDLIVDYPIFDYLLDSDFCARQKVRKLLFKYKTSKKYANIIKNLLKEVINPENNSVSEVLILGELKDKRIAPYLIKVLNTTPLHNDYKRYQIALALGKIGDKHAINAVDNAVWKAHSHSGVKNSLSQATVTEEALMMLGEYPDKFEQILQRSISFLTATSRQISLDKLTILLSNINYNEAIEKYIALLKHKNVNVRCFFAEILGNIMDGRAIEPLIDAFYSVEHQYKEFLQSLKEGSLMCHGGYNFNHIQNALSNIFEDSDIPISDESHGPDDFKSSWEKVKSEGKGSDRQTRCYHVFRIGQSFWTLDKPTL
jgi:HEAT repeat protein